MREGIKIALIFIGFAIVLVGSIFMRGNPEAAPTPYYPDLSSNTYSPTNESALDDSSSDKETKMNARNLNGTETSLSLCTKFEYSRWSHCATDGTQSRVITEAYPNGCRLTQSASIIQQQQCGYTPISLSLADIVNKMVEQVYNAPDQTIFVQYFAGYSGDYIATNKWKLSADGTTLFLESTSKNRATEAITDHIILADTNKDFRPDIYSNNGDDWYTLGDQESALAQNYTTVWAVASAYFGSYLLDY